MPKGIPKSKNPEMYKNKIKTASKKMKTALNKANKQLPIHTSGYVQEVLDAAPPFPEMLQALGNFNDPYTSPVQQADEILRSVIGLNELLKHRNYPGAEKTLIYLLERYQEKVELAYPDPADQQVVVTPKGITAAFAEKMNQLDLGGTTEKTDPPVPQYTDEDDTEEPEFDAGHEPVLKFQPEA